MLQTDDAVMVTEMNAWLGARSGAVAGEGQPAASVALQKARAWALWKQSVLREELTLIEVLEGPRPERWSGERVQAERSRFEEFWSNYVVRQADRYLGALRAQEA